VYMLEKHLITRDVDKVSMKIARLENGMARHGLATAGKRAKKSMYANYQQELLMWLANI